MLSITRDRNSRIPIRLQSGKIPGFHLKTRGLELPKNELFHEKIYWDAANKSLKLNW